MLLRSFLYFFPTRVFQVTLFTFTLPLMPRNPDARVRAMEPTELPHIIDLFTRAFINDPTMCYYGHVPALVQDPAHPTSSEEKTIRDLHAFWAFMVKIPQLLGGNIDVVVIPSTNGSPEKSQGSASTEEIVAAALWLPPGTTLDFTLSTALRGGFHKVAFAWGFTGLKVCSNLTVITIQCLRMFYATEACRL